MEIYYESVFRKIVLIFLLLMFAAFLAGYTGNAAASSSAIQVQSGEVNIDNGAVIYSVSQGQAAKVLTGDGVITQTQDGSEKISLSSEDEVKSITVRLSEAQSVDNPTHGRQ